MEDIDNIHGFLMNNSWAIYKCSGHFSRKRRSSGECQKYTSHEMNITVIHQEPRNVLFTHVLHFSSLA